MLILVTCELLGQFVKTLTANYKHSRQNCENLSQQVPIQTSLKLKNCSGFFIGFLKSTLNFEYLEKKHQSQRLSIKEIINCEKNSCLNVQKAMFHETHWQITC